MRRTLPTITAMTLASTVALAASHGGFDEVDTNGDGSLDKEEVMAAGMKFDAADANSDGKVSKSEYKAVASMMESEMEEGKAAESRESREQEATMEGEETGTTGKVAETREDDDHMEENSMNMGEPMEDTKEGKAAESREAAE